MIVCVCVFVHAHVCTYLCVCVKEVVIDLVRESNFLFVIFRMQSN